LLDTGRFLEVNKPTPTPTLKPNQNPPRKFTQKTKKLSLQMQEPLAEPEPEDEVVKLNFFFSYGTV
jgi:hypothetical protein